MDRRSFLRCAVGGALGGTLGVPLGYTVDRTLLGIPRRQTPDLTVEFAGYYLECRILRVLSDLPDPPLDPKSPRLLIRTIGPIPPAHP